MPMNDALRLITLGVHLTGPLCCSSQCQKQAQMVTASSLRRKCYFYYQQLRSKEMEGEGDCLQLLQGCQLSLD